MANLGKIRLLAVGTHGSLHCFSLQTHESFRTTTPEVPGFPWQQMLGSYRSQARWTARLLSSTPATMSSTAFQSSLLRMLPVLSDTLSAPREGGSRSSSTADKSYQIKKGSKL